MLLDNVTDVSNSIVQERYVTVSVAVKNIDEARSYFCLLYTSRCV